MAEPTTSTAVLIQIASTAAGLTLFGVATGLQPQILLVGLLGGFWAMTYKPPAGLMARILFLLGSSLVAGYVAPVAAAAAAAAAVSTLSWWPRDITREWLQYPVAFFSGFLAIRYLGPALMRKAAQIDNMEVKSQ